MATVNGPGEIRGGDHIQNPFADEKDSTQEKVYAFANNVITTLSQTDRQKVANMRVKGDDGGKRPLKPLKSLKGQRIEGDGGKKPLTHKNAMPYPEDKEAKKK